MRGWALNLVGGCVAAVVCATAVSAQPPAAKPAQAAPAKPAPDSTKTEALPGIDAAQQWRLERLGPNHWKLTGDAEIQRDDVKFFADVIEVFTDTHMLLATGNVVFSTATHHIAADKAEFNTETKLGTFFNASGSATLGGENTQKNQFGSQDTDVYFYGKTLEKIGERKYRISDGGFTTCVQPRPRWELTSGTVILSLDHYALLTNSVMKVKSVPMLYLPVVYYPLSKDDRSSGLLMPVWGTSTLRGKTISNAFFWAINRSQDATFMHDWFSKTGQAFGTEYRYVASRSSQGNAYVYLLREKAVETTAQDGTVTSTPGKKGVTIRSNVSQDLPFKLKGRVRVDYFSEISQQQTYYTNVYDSSLRQRYYGGNLSGTWGAYSVSSSVDRQEMFYSSTSSTTTGSLPRVTFSRAERPIKYTPFYMAVSGEYLGNERQTDYNGTTSELNVKRFDMTPTIRFPFRKWPFLTANTSLAWRFTRWNQSYDETGLMVESPVHRSYFDAQTRITGPVFNRIWNTNNGFAEKIKHTVEPNVTIQRVTSFDTYDQIVKIDSADYTVGGSTRVIYGLTNRVYAKRNDGNRQGQAREILNVGLRQTYYTNDKASLADGQYVSGTYYATTSKYSPISLTARIAPWDSINSNLRAEYDNRSHMMKSLSVQTTYAWRDALNTSVMWNKQRYFSNTDPKLIVTENEYINSQTSFKLQEGKIGGDASFNYDATNKVMMQKRFVAYYNAQCCGVSFEYQVYDFSGYSSAYGLSVKKDKRFNLSFTLAGLGTFSNVLGALGGSSR